MNWKEWSQKRGMKWKQPQDSILMYFKIYFGRKNWNYEGVYVSSFSIAVRCHDQSNLQKEGFIWCLWFQRAESPSSSSWQKAGVITGWHGNRQSWPQASMTTGSHSNSQSWQQAGGQHVGMTTSRYGNPQACSRQTWHLEQQAES